VSTARDESKCVLLELALQSTLGGQVCDFFRVPVKTG